MKLNSAHGLRRSTQGKNLCHLDADLTTILIFVTGGRFAFYDHEAIPAIGGHNRIAIRIMGRIMGRRDMDMNRRKMMGLTLFGAVGMAAIGHQVQAAPLPDDLREALERDPNAPILGNPDGDITLTEFFDYNCPFCRSSAGDLQRLVADDPELRIVLREWPVFGEGSNFAAQAALAARAQGKYEDFHFTMMNLKGMADENTAMAMAEKIGLDIDQLRADMEAPEVMEHINLSMALAGHMGLIGTPSFIAGNEIRFGRQTLSELQGMIERARAELG